MKAVQLQGFGDVNVLQMVDISIPQPNSQQLLIAVKAAALNRADILQRQGKYQPPAGESLIPGLELAGIVSQIGTEVKNFKVGDRVFGLVAGGAYAEYCLLDQDLAMHMPTHWDFVTAAAVPEVFFTANETVFELGELKPQQTILIHAAGSGVGTAAVQMAKHIDATVYVTAGSDAKLTRIMDLGASAGVNYKQEDFAVKIADWTQQQGVDVIEDFIGANYLQQNLQSLKEGGRLICVALMGGSKATIDLSLILRKRLQIKGSVMRTRDLTAKRLIKQRFDTRWLPVLASGKIKPIIDKVFAFTEVQQAQQYMETNLNFGKIVLQME